MVLYYDCHYFHFERVNVRVSNEAADWSTTWERSYPASAPHYAVVFFSMQLKGQLPILSYKMFLTARNNNLTWLESEMSLLFSLFLSILTMPSHIHKTQFWIWATTLYWRATGYTALGWLQGQLCSWKHKWLSMLWGMQTRNLLRNFAFLRERSKQL